MLAWEDGLMSERELGEYLLERFCEISERDEVDEDGGRGLAMICGRKVA